MDMVQTMEFPPAAPILPPLDESKKTARAKRGAFNETKDRQVYSPETMKVIKQLRGFLADELDFIPEEAIEKIPSEQLLLLLQKYWDEPASFEHFVELLGSLSQLPPGTDITNFDPETIRQQWPDADFSYTQYLLHKMPQSLRQRWEEQVYRDGAANKPAVLDRLQQAASRPDMGLLAGFHVSPLNLDTVETIAPTSSTDTFIGGGKEAVDGSAKTWYSTDSKNLYGTKGTDYLYIVEGSRSEQPYDQSVEAYKTYRPLPIRHQIRLNKEVIEALGLDFKHF